MKNSTIIVPVAVAAILGIGYTVGRAQNNNTDSSSITESSHVVGTYSGQSTDFTYAAENTVNCVVHIMTKYTPKTSSSSGQPNFGGNDIFEYFFGDRGGFQQLQPQPRSASGSGVILEKEGYIVTNNHVVEGADSITVVLNDKRSYVAKIVGTDPSTDLALIKVEADNLPAIKIGDSENLRVGEWVLAVGNPLGLNNTVTAGIVSAKARSMGQGVSSMIQTDAAINQGNSGGALVNTRGELIGINAMIYSQTGSNIGYGFAIPTAIMNKAVDDFKKYGSYQRAMIGIQGGSVKDYVDAMKDQDKDVKDYGTMEGVRIDKVVEDGAASVAGLEAEDVITEVDGKKVKTMGDLQAIIAQKRPGDKVTIKFLRNKKEKTSTLTLKNAQGNTKVVKNADLDILGGQFRQVTESQMKELQISYGLQVIKVSGGKLKEAGIPQGFIIQRVNDEPMKSISDLSEAVKKASTSKEPVLYIQGLMPTGKKAYFAVALQD